MANATGNLVRLTIGKEGREKLLDVNSGARIFEGTMVTQLVATGKAVKASTAAASYCVGVASHEVDDTAATGVKSLMVEDDRTFAFNGGTAGDAIPAATISGAILYIVDDNTVSTNSSASTRLIAGSFRGFEPDGKVRVHISAFNNAALAS